MMARHFFHSETTREDGDRFQYSYGTDAENIPAEDGAATTADEQRIYLTRAEVIEIIDRKIAAIRVYVSEADITEAQERVKAIVEYSKY